MEIGGILVSSVELHGKMSLVIFMAKCPLRCPFCHNGEILDEGEEKSLEEIYKEIDKSKDFIDAVVISGGEPLVQLDDLIKILEYSKEKGLITKLDTSGVYPNRLKKILDLNLADNISMDVKAPFGKYKEIIGFDIGEKVKESMDLINKNKNINFEIRTTFVPSLLSEEDVNQIVKEIDSDIYTIQQFRNRNVIDESLYDVEPPNPHYLKKIGKSIKPLFNGKIKIKSGEFGEESLD